MEQKPSKRRKILNIAVICAVIVLLVVAAFVTSADTVQQTFWSLIPPLIAIVLALVTKEVYSSLFIGVIAGALLYSGFSFEGTMLHVFDDGVIAVLSDSYNVGILIFLVILGILVCLMNRAGGSRAFGEWAGKHIKTRVGAQLATIALGILIFIDDYFNCLTVGSVMRPVTDKHHISRAKLAYLIDATAAPVCIIAPVSSWAAAVSGYAPEGTNGISLFIRTIPYNFYALLTIAMMIMLAVAKTDYGPMAIHERNAVLHNDLYTTPDRPYANAEDDKISSKGGVIDLILPVVVLIIACVIGMIYTGGFFDGVNFVEAFADCDASRGLVYGSIIALLFTIVFYLVRRVLTFKDCMDCVPEGFKSMVAPILILTFAWSLKAMTDSLGAKEFVAELVANSAEGFMNWLPAIIFLIAVFLSFSTGTSWGTFGILIPIVISIFPETDPMMIISMSACMAGAVCGDHCSPISDTTIMSSAGARCNHLNHVTTQLPYAMTCAIVSFFTYIIAGFTKSAAISLPCGLAILFATILIIRGKEDPELRAAK
ncbi:MAG: Na+/H+ antiporter NhaC family protein [Eubacteriales bacterium]|jgi:tetracycline resistance efflux pump